jgi:serine/threonine protein phosphatase 1
MTKSRPYPVTRIGKNRTCTKACIWNIDTGAAFKGPEHDVDTKSAGRANP